MARAIRDTLRPFSKPWAAQQRAGDVGPKAGSPRARHKMDDSPGCVTARLLGPSLTSGSPPITVQRQSRPASSSPRFL